VAGFCEKFYESLRNDQQKFFPGVYGKWEKKLTINLIENLKKVRGCGGFL
jgi:hypothetical protein